MSRVANGQNGQWTVETAVKWIVIFVIFFFVFVVVLLSNAALLVHSFAFNLMWMVYLAMNDGPMDEQRSILILIFAISCNQQSIKILVFAFNWDRCNGCASKRNRKDIYISISSIKADNKYAIRANNRPTKPHTHTFILNKSSIIHWPHRTLALHSTMTKAELWRKERQRQGERRTKISHRIVVALISS